jgi:MauM/NapG family ferredoxin protein
MDRCHHYPFGDGMGKDPKDPKGVSRRELLTFWRKPLEELSRKPAPAPPPALRPPPLRPPGMMHELMLVNSCIKCGKCVEICPADAIHPLGPGWGDKATGTPFIDARQQPCVLCNELKCTHVCPSGALIPVFQNRDVTMGTAVLDAMRCVAHHGQACDVCFKACPIPGAIVIDSDRRVSVADSLCVGCGLCEHVCPTEPASVRVVPRD